MLPPSRIPRVDVAEVRAGTGLSVLEFATRYGLTKESVRKWEAGISQPYKTARIVLALVASHREVLEDVLSPRRPGF
jgi:DNA-binding transcriptional regulator YiaG